MPSEMTERRLVALERQVAKLLDAVEGLVKASKPAKAAPKAKKS